MLFDLIVIGSGPAGQRVAVQGAKAGKKVALIEAYPAMGGACTHFGTLPSKSFRESVYRWSLGSRGTLGQEMEHSRTVTKVKREALPDMSRLRKRRDRVVSSESQIVFDQLKRNHVQIFHGQARFIAANEVEVTGKGAAKKLSAEFLFIATGGRPVAPAHLPVNGRNVLDSNTILNIKKLPRTLVVLGAGIIGTEYASMFSIAGTQVHLVDRRHEILAAVDREIVDHLVSRFESEGMRLHLKSEATSIDQVGEGVRVHLAGGEKIDADVALVAYGRFGNSDGLGLEAIGVDRDERGLIQVDEVYRTSVPNIYAVGDVVGAPALASTSMEQGRIACCHALKLAECRMPEYFPYGIYTIPEISMIGPTEEELVVRKVAYVAGTAQYRELARGQIVGDQWGLLKLLADRESLKLLGVHIIGDNAADLIHIGQAVMHFGGDIEYFIQNVFNYPTMAEGYKTAAFHAVNQLRGTTSRTR